MSSSAPYSRKPSAYVALLMWDTQFHTHTHINIYKYVARKLPWIWIITKIKLPCTCHEGKLGRGGGGGCVSVAPLCVNIDARWKWAVNVFGLFAPGKEYRYRLNYGLGGAQQPGWSQCEMRQSRPVGILTLVLPTQSLVAMPIMITRPQIWIVMFPKLVLWEKNVSLLRLHLFVQSKSIHSNLCEGNVIFSHWSL
jgi:hypothetical protein